MNLDYDKRVRRTDDAEVHHTSLPSHRPQSRHSPADSPGNTAGGGEPGEGGITVVEGRDNKVRPCQLSQPGVNPVNRVKYSQPKSTRSTVHLTDGGSREGVRLLRLKLSAISLRRL